MKGPLEPEETNAVEHGAAPRRYRHQHCIGSAFYRYFGAQLYALGSAS